MPRDPRAHQLSFAANGAALFEWGGIVKDLRPKQAGQVQALARVTYTKAVLDPA